LERVLEGCARRRARASATRSKSLTVLYLKERVLRAYFASNTGAKEFPVFQRLIRHKKDLSGRWAQLRDRTFAVKGLA
jgi:hypothetical protein